MVKDSFVVSLISFFLGLHAIHFLKLERTSPDTFYLFFYTLKQNITHITYHQRFISISFSLERVHFITFFKVQMIQFWDGDGDVTGSP